MTIREAYNRARRSLAAVTEDPAFEAGCLVEQFFGMTRAAMLTHGDRPAMPEAEKVKSAAGLLKTICWRLLLAFRISCSTTPALPLISGF